MRDEMDARLWDAHGRELSDGLHRFFKAVHHTFCRMAAINFSAPWRKPAKNC